MAAPTIQDCADYVESILDDYIGTGKPLNGSSAYPVDKPDPLPYGMVIIGPGTFGGNSSSWGTDLYSLKVLLIVGTGQGGYLAAKSLGDLPATIAHALEADPTLGGKASTFRDITFSGWASIEWNAIPYGGYVLTINDIKLLVTL